MGAASWFWLASGVLTLGACESVVIVDRGERCTVSRTVKDGPDGKSVETRRDCTPAPPKSGG